VAAITPAHRFPRVASVEDDLSAFCCQNCACPDYGRHGSDNLKVDSRYGKGKQVRMLLCRTCKRRFSERKGTTLFGSQLSAAKVALLKQCLAEGKSVREVARLIQVNRNTVVRYGRIFRDENAADS
jgi:LacI family transcriptional regulator, galactose operon repressor